MRLILRRFSSFIKRYGKVAIFSLILAGAFGLPQMVVHEFSPVNLPEVFSTEMVFAQDNTDADIESSGLNKATGLFITSQTAPITTILGVLASIYAIIAWALGQMIVMVLGAIIIPILGYNSFSDSTIISLGWPLVRDAVNMFVILILLWIAIKTMLGIGGGSQGAQQQLVKLFLAVVAVNFSRTICLLIIDAGQIVMFTFVNALSDVAAGNFTNFLMLNDFFTMDTVTSGTAVLDATGYLATTYMQVVLLAIVLAVISILAIVFLYRIVILWVLIILSPAAFFLKGIGGIAPMAAGKANDWWSKFIGAVTLGPIMTFFLWLGLATAGSGTTMARSENFPQFSDSGSAGIGSFLADIFQIDSILSLFIGLILIIIGFQAASSAASGMGGIASTLVNEKMGKRLVGGVMMGTTVAPAVMGAKFGGKELERRTGIGSKFGSGLTNLGNRIRNSSASKYVPGLEATGAKIAGGGQDFKGMAKGVTTQDRKNAQEAVSSMTEDQKVKLLNTEDKDLTYQQGIRKSEIQSSLLNNSKNEVENMKKKLISQGESEQEALSIIDEYKSAEISKMRKDPKKYFVDSSDPSGDADKLMMQNPHLLKDENGNFDKEEFTRLVEKNNNSLRGFNLGKAVKNPSLKF